MQCNDIGIGAFRRLSVGTNTAFFMDSLPNAQFADISN
jgi:hypothetical protein